MGSKLDISKITDNLYIAANPRAVHRDTLIDLNIGLIINMILQKKHDSELDKPPLRVIHLKTIDFFLTPIPIKLLISGTIESLRTMNEGKSVLVYCKKGVHRSPAMATSILIGQGYSVYEAIALVKSKRKAAKPDTWYIKRQLKKFATEWNKYYKNNYERGWNDR